jgi:hypothetical protein
MHLDHHPNPSTLSLSEGCFPASCRLPRHEEEEKDSPSTGSGKRGSETDAEFRHAVLRSLGFGGSVGQECAPHQRSAEWILTFVRMTGGFVRMTGLGRLRWGVGR